jgi:predicted lysophospholipase L1 biosynthesis ABC-type transport system permease subunit
MNSEPSRLVAAITAAITATIGVLTVTNVFSAELGGALTVAAGAWVLAAGEIVRARVTPNDRVAAVKQPDPPEDG